MPIEVLLIIAAAGAFLSAAIASTKNRSVAAWAVLGACFPLIAAIAIVCLPPHERLEEQVS